MTGTDYERQRAQQPGRKMHGSVRWRQASKAFLAANPTCEYCGAPSTCVDHKIAHKGDWRLFWDRSNWAPACTSCNSRKAVQAEGGMGKQPRRFHPRIQVDADGMPIGDHPWNHESAESLPTVARGHVKSDGGNIELAPKRDREPVIPAPRGRLSIHPQVRGK